MAERPARPTPEELARCPFCGGLAREPFWYNGTWETGCGGDHECAGTDVLAPIDAWNRRRQEKTEVTSEMIEAGLAEFNLHDPRICSTRDMVEAVFLAMWRAWVDQRGAE